MIIVNGIIVCMHMVATKNHTIHIYIAICDIFVPYVCGMKYVYGGYRTSAPDTDKLQ